MRITIVFSAAFNLSSHLSPPHTPANVSGVADAAPGEPAFNLVDQLR